MVRRGLCRSLTKRFDELAVKRVLSENSSKWLGGKPFVRVQSLRLSGEVSYVSREYLDSDIIRGRCYILGEARKPYHILAARYSQTLHAQRLQAALPLCVCERALRRCLTGKPLNHVVACGVVVMTVSSRCSAEAQRARGAAAAGAAAAGTVRGTGEGLHGSSASRGSDAARATACGASDAATEAPDHLVSSPQFTKSGGSGHHRGSSSSSATGQSAMIERRESVGDVVAPRHRDPHRPPAGPTTAAVAVAPAPRPAPISRDRAGWLHKRSGNMFRRFWQARFVRLTFTDTQLEYFLSDGKRERRRGKYSLDKSCTVQHSSKESSAEYPNAFKLRGKGFELTFAARSALQEQAWIDSIRNTIVYSQRPQRLTKK